MFNKQTFVPGQLCVPFLYPKHGDQTNELVLRSGEVDRVADTYVTIKFTLTPKPGDNRDHEFKSFNYSKMKPV